ncbi:MAG: helix-turn-helix transcriptional regulator [Candidatus Parabeggiatoa sp.]|nr:helix-turn-helix transcriptional regulator [Candidatus Parabeggiatoa sp.]
MSISKRLREIIDTKGMNLTEFSKVTEIPYRTLQNYVSGERPIKIDILTKIYTQTGISLSWLLTGKGEMYERKGTEKVETLGGAIEWLNEWWDGADEKHRHWLEVQMRRCFPEYATWADKEE